MARRYLHIDIETCQASKYPQGPCGDVIAQHRTELATDIILCDGIGSGMRAYIAATMHTARLQTLLQGGFSLRQAFASLVATLENWRDPEKPYAAVSLARILNDGEATVLTYDAPAPVLVGRNSATVLPGRPFVTGSTVAQESSCFLTAGEGLLLASDGITQAGMGHGLNGGWGSEGVAAYVSQWLSSRRGSQTLAQSVHRKAVKLDGDRFADDMTVVLGHCRHGRVVNIFTGPPTSKRADASVVTRFLALPGPKVVCGATTAAIVARTLGRELKVDAIPTSLIAPPKYEIEGVDLVTEGAVTLNQLCHVLDMDVEDVDELNPVTEFADLLHQADRVNIVVGCGANPANDSLGFRQQGILKRNRVVPLLVAKLRERGKLVLVTEV